MTLDAVDAGRDGASWWIRLTSALLFVPAGLLTIAVALLEFAPESVNREVPENFVAIAATATGALCVLAFGVVALDRIRREPQPGLRLWFLLLAGAAFVALILHTLAFAFQGESSFLLSSMAVLITAPLAAVSLTVLCWPTDFEPRQRNSAMVDAAVGVLGLLVIWAFLVIPNLPVEDSFLLTAVGASVSVMQLGLLATVLVLAATAHRRSSLAITQVILLQLGVLVYLGGDVAGPLLADLTVATTHVELVTFVVASALFSATAIRASRERELASQLWMRDVWSTVIPLSPVALATAGLLLWMAVDQTASTLVAAAISVILLGLISALIWVRTIAGSAVRKASVAVAATNLDQATGQSWFRALTQHSREMVIVLDSRGRIVYGSENVLHLLGVTGGPLQGRDLSDVIPGLDNDTVGGAISGHDDDDLVPLDVTVTDASGTARDLQFMVSSLQGMSTDGFVLTGTDVTDARRMRALIGESRRRDRLTGLLNKEAFIESLEEVQNWALPQSLAVLVVDLFEFRRFNDVHGQDVGDSILRAVADLLDRLPGPILAVARIGGNEFAILLRDRRPYIAAEATAGLVRTSLTNLSLFDGDSVWVRAAFGCASPGEGDGHAAALVEAADLAASRSKGDPELGLVRYEASMREALLDELQLTSELRGSLAAGDFVPYYQPIMDLRTGRISGVEALVRRRLPDGGWQSPAEFIPLAERVGLVSQLDRSLREAALADLADLSQRWPYMRMSLNLSPLEFSDNLVEQIADQIERSGAPVSSLVFEVTESAVARSEEMGKAIIDGLQELGCQVALDDFGTGHSSLAGLASMRVDLLKIDQSFVSNLTNSPRDVSLLRGVVDLGRGLGLRIVAEGISTIEQADLLRGMGCDYGQGFLFTEPLPLNTLIDWLEPDSTAGQVVSRS